jgi:beta-N-acetylhexosaminidase
MNSHAPLIIDVAGLSLVKTDRRHLAHPLTGGLVCTRFWESRAQLTASALKSRASEPTRSIDHEGQARAAVFH